MASYDTPSQDTPEEALKALAQLFDRELKDPQARKRFFAEPGKAVAPGLPASVSSFLEDLSYEELRVLARTYEAMQEGGLTYDVGGTKVSFL